MAHGRHIKVLGRGSPVLLGSTKTVRDFLEKAIVGLGMRMLGDVVIHDVELEIKKLDVEPFEDEGGVTGIAVLSTSHVSIHTWPLRYQRSGEEMFVLDAYSCRDFQPLVVTGLLRNVFNARGLATYDVSAALEYSSNRSGISALHI
jgi:S-adenosylmethionine/arginine decarboxylase-like enzyme